MLAEMADAMLSAGQADALALELTGAVDVWDDSVASGEVLELQGRHAATSALLDLAVLRPGEGSAPARFLLPPLGSATPPARVVRGALVVDGLLRGGNGVGPVVLGTESGSVLVVPSEGLDLMPIAGFDPALGLVRVSGQLGSGRSEPVSDDWATLSARACRGLAHELLGVAAAALAIATDHVQTRTQFGQPIGAFQSVRHRLADALIAATGARELLTATGTTRQYDWDGLLLKAHAGRAALLAVQAAQQVCGAMGFTAEFGLHRYVRRAYVLDSLFGGSEAAEWELGAYVLATGHLPDRLVSL